MNDRTEIANRIRGLSETELVELRTQAEQLTRQRIKAPSLDDIKQRHARQSTYPRSLQILTLLLVVVVLFVAGIISAQHLTTATGSWLYFVLAEPTILVGTLSYTVLFRNNRVGRMLIIMTVLVALALAFVGNYVSQDVDSLIQLLMVVSPPLFTVSMAIVLERYFMTSIRADLDAAREYEQQQTAYQRTIDNLEATPEYHNTFANLAWEALIAQNNRGRYASEMRSFLTSLPLVERRRLVQREISRLDWYTSTPDDTHDGGDGMTLNRQQLIQSGPSGDTPSRKNGHASGEMMDAIAPSPRSPGILGVIVTEAPDPTASSRDRMGRLAQDARQHPELFDAHTRAELAAFYRISTGSVSNVKRAIQQNGSSSSK